MKWRDFSDFDASWEDEHDISEDLIRYVPLNAMQVKAQNICSMLSALIHWNQESRRLLLLRSRRSLLK